MYEFSYWDNFLKASFFHRMAQNKGGWLHLVKEISRSIWCYSRKTNHCNYFTILLTRKLNRVETIFFIVSLGVSCKHSFYKKPFSLSMRVMQSLSSLAVCMSVHFMWNSLLIHLVWHFWGFKSNHYCKTFKRIHKVSNISQFFKKVWVWVKVRRENSKLWSLKIEKFQGDRFST